MSVQCRTCRKPFNLGYEGVGIILLELHKFFEYLDISYLLHNSSPRLDFLLLHRLIVLSLAFFKRLLIGTPVMPTFLHTTEQYAFWDSGVEPYGGLPLPLS